jgi:hypothetical protein
MPGFLGQDAAVKQEVMTKVDAVSHHCQLLPFIQSDMTVVIMNPGTDADTSLIHTIPCLLGMLYMPSFYTQVILDRTKKKWRLS